MNRLIKFYNPSQYKPPSNREPFVEDQITLYMGDTLARTEAPGGIAGPVIGLMLTLAETETTVIIEQKRLDREHRDDGE